MDRKRRRGKKKNRGGTPLILTGKMPVLLMGETPMPQ